MFIGSFVTDETDKTLKFYRWLCVIWLSLQATFLILFSWLSLFGFIPFLGVILILLPQQELSKQTLIETLSNRKGYRIPIIIILSMSGLLYWWHYNPLPSDEAMIAHFYEHRGEIEELVKRYRAWVPSGAVPNWYAVQENKVLLEKAGVKYVDANAPDWHPNPYSKEAAKQFGDSISAGKVPSLNPYSTIVVELLDEDHPTRHFAKVLTASGDRWIFKGLAFIPEVARIEGENLWLPAHGFFGVRSKMRIFPSLNSYPSHWTKGECVFRQFETHWFIRLCAAAI